MTVLTPPVVSSADGVTPAPPRRPGGAKGRKEAAFWEELAKELGPGDAGRAREFMTALAAPPDLVLEYGKRSVVLKMMAPKPFTGRASLLTLHPTDGLNNDQHLLNMLVRRGIPPDVVDPLVNGYWRRLHEVEPQFALEGRIQTETGDFVPFRTVKSRLPELSRCVERAAEDVRAAFAEAGVAPAAVN